MGRACCVLGCPSGGDAPSHQIPKNPALFQKWKSMIYSEKIKHLTDEQISKCAVCYRHFADDDYLVTFRVRKLKRGIAPSLNLPNVPASSRVSGAVDVEPRPAASTAGTFVVKEEIEIEEVTEVPRIIEEVSETPRIALFEDAPEEVDESCLSNQSQALPDRRAEERINSTAVTFELIRRERTPRRKRIKLTAVQLPLLRRKQQAKQYEKTPTIQKLLSFLTPAEAASIKTRIQKARYSPKVYVKVYHDVAQRKALGQL